MKDKLIQYFSAFTRFTRDELAVLTDSMAIAYFEKGSFIVKEGQHNTNTFFVLHGLVRQYQLIDGEEIITNFFSEGQWIISLTGFSKDTAAKDYLVCVEDTAVVVGDEQKAQALFTAFPRFETLSRAVLETEFAAQQRKLRDYMTATPEQRYLQLLTANPNILQRVPQYQIASYIGVKPESLSRIRKRLQKRKEDHF